MTARYDPDEAREFLTDWLIRDEGDETRAFCPLCEDIGASNSPSASFNFAANKWNCLKTEEDGGSISKLIKTLQQQEVTPIRRTPPPRQEAAAQPLSETDAEAWHEDLMARADLVEAIEETRGWSADTLREFMIGYHRGRYTIPIYDENDQLVNIRQYKPNPGEGQQKFINVKGHGKNRLWGFDTLRNSEWVLLCAGEPDRILAVQEGFPAITWTGGESNFQPEWGSHFEGKIVKVCLDADDAGRDGTQKVTGALPHYAAELWTVELPEKTKGYDVTDVILEEGPEALQGYIDAAERIELPDTNPITETDHGNALRLIDAYGEVFRHVADMKRWHHWDGTRWAFDVNNRAIGAAHINLAHMLPPGSFKHNALSRYGISAALTVAEYDRRISILADQLDTHGDLLNTPSGIVDLKTGDLGPFDPDLLLTRSTAYPADLEAPHPKWDAFLAQTFEGYENLIPYLQQLFGLALVGSAPEHVLPFLHGAGRNGKGVITLVLQGLMGNADSGGYALSAPDGFLMSGRENKHETEIARIRGARLVVCSEQSSSKKFDEQRVKKFSGGDRLSGRFMHGNLFEFEPTHLLWVMSNRLPAVKEGGPAFWERVKMIPFYNVVPPAQRIKEFEQILLAAEGPAILGWSVHGAVDVLANGLRHPAEVVKATEEYKIAEDSLASFVQEECLLDRDSRVKVGDFMARFREHCEGMDAEILSAKAVTQRLTGEYPVQDYRNGQGRFYKGVTLNGKLSMSDS